MATEVRMAKLSPTMETGTVNRWLKKEGEKVSSGDALAEIETDKASMPLEAFEDGVLLKIMEPEGATVKVGELMAVLGAQGENISALIAAKSAAPAQQASAPVATPPVPTPAVVKPAAPEPTPPAQPKIETPAPVHQAAGTDRVKASPLARKIAAERGIDLRTLTPSGPGGRIIERDVPAAAPAQKMGAARQARVAPAVDIPLTNMRQTISKRLLMSKQTIPHWYCYSEVLMDRAMQVREDLNALAAEGGTKISVNDLIVKACALALLKHPEVNASFNQTVIHRHGEINISIAVSTQDGLYTPVLRRADGLALSEIAVQVKALAKKAVEKKLKPEDFAGSGFTISNLGMFGVDHFFAIINPPEAAILAVGAVKPKPIVNAQGQVVAGQVMGLSLACDHRAVDGALGAHFLGTVKNLLEHPAQLLI
jgi:pyruvate dehydrogenase E2 component (dihydrolipoamide acetyltransferase)